jgi:endonuclease/exonuclease/phosphatase family metal-dependent hydrolase
MRIVTANVHADVDGWGRRTNALARALALEPDLLMVQELWQGVTEDDVQRILDAGYEGRFTSLATCTRVTESPATSRRWERWSALLTGDEGLFFGERQPLNARRMRQLAAAHGTQQGEWGFGLFTRLPVRDITTYPLPQLRRDRTRRAIIVATLELEGTIIKAAALHGPHLSHGSLLTYRHVQRSLKALAREFPVVVAGDFNCWRPLLRLALPGWTSAVRGRTWPADWPHSQIDHILLRGPWRVTNATVAPTGSDHHALVASLELR